MRRCQVSLYTLAKGYVNATVFAIDLATHPRYLIGILTKDGLCDEGILSQSNNSREQQSLTFSLSTEQGRPSLECSLERSVDSFRAPSDGFMRFKRHHLARKELGQGPVKGPTLTPFMDPNTASSNSHSFQTVLLNPQMDHGVQTDTVAYEDKAVETSIIWNSQRFKCKCCSKPPRMPNQEEDGDKTSLFLIDHGTWKSSSPQEPSGRGPKIRPRRRSQSRQNQRLVESGSSSDESVSSASSGGSRRSSQTDRVCWNKDLDHTSFRMQVRSLELLLGHWNCHVDTTSCCHFHTSATNAKHALNWLIEHVCKKQWEPHSGWQCPRCKGCNHGSHDWCYICGKRATTKAAMSL